MRRLVAMAGSACLLACAEWRLPSTFPRDAAQFPVIHEQALRGLSGEGAAVAELVDADGIEPQLALRIFDARSGTGRTELVAPPQLARAVADELRSRGTSTAALLQAAAPRLWPEAVQRARSMGFHSRPAEAPDQVLGIFAVAGVTSLGSIPLALRLDDARPGVLALTISDRAAGERGDGIELLLSPIAGDRIAPQLFIDGATLWLLSGSVLPGEPLHRSVGLRHVSLRRAEAMLHNAHGIADDGAGELERARREFDRAATADPRFVDALYNGASAAARAHDEEKAVALLRRAAEADGARVQVLGRGDEALKALRSRADVRALLGLRRPPRDDVPPPP